MRERALLGRAVQDSLPAVSSVRKGIRSSFSRDFMVCEWKHVVAIDAAGDTKTAVECLLVNTTDDEIATVCFPLYFDRPPEDVGAWAKAGKASLRVDTNPWDSDAGSGLFTVHFLAPLKPREHTRLRWGYGNKGSFAPGDEWWEWYFGRIHSAFTVKLDFASCWHVSGIRGLVVPEGRISSPPRQRRSAITWAIKAPMPGRKYRLEFSLTREGTTDSQQEDGQGR